MPTQPDEHIIDNLARRIIPMALPSSWIHREISGGDYGVDMLVEIFSDGVATGNILQLQIKGTKKLKTKKLKVNDISEIIFDCPVKTLRYAELFASSFLLVICPVEEHPPKFYYLWLQEYIKVVLDYDNKFWRANTKSVRLKIPVANVMPSSEQRLLYMAHFPQRVFHWLEASRMLHFLLGCFDGGLAFAITYSREADMRILCRIEEELRALIKMDYLFANPLYPEGTRHRDLIITPSLCFINMLVNGPPYNLLSCRDLVQYGDLLDRIEESIEMVEGQIVESILYDSAKRHILLLARIFTHEFGYSYKRILWIEDKKHEF